MADATRTGSFVQAFNRAAKHRPGNPLLVAGRETLTYGELLKRVGRLTQLFKEAGLNVGDRVIVATRHDLEAVTLFLALLRNGMTTVMIDPGAPAQAARTLIQAADAQGIVLDHELRQTWRTDHHAFLVEIRKSRENGASLLTKLLRKKSSEAADPDSYPGMMEHLEPSEPPTSIRDETDALILFTSGTTSQPKGVRLTHVNIAHHLGTLCRQFGYDASARILNFLPLHHTDGLTLGPLIALWCGASVHRPAPFSIQNLPILLDAIYAHRLTHFVANPTILALIQRLGEDYTDAFMTEDFRFILSSAAYLEASLWEGFQEAFRTRVANMYGLTETVTGGLFCGPGEETFRIGTVGKPVDCEIRLVDDEGQEVLCGKTGELLMRGSNIMQGYLNDPDGTAEVLRDGWFHTGDLATRDNDGFVRIVGRKKSLIITGGRNVHPLEVTEVLNRHPRVRDAIAFGEEDRTWGEHVAAAVVPSTPGTLEPMDVVEFCRQELAPHKVPARVYLLPHLPRTASGKIVVNKVRELVQRQEPEWDGAHGELLHRLYTVASHCFSIPITELGPGSTPEMTPGWDSLAHLAFVVALEETFGVRLAPREIIALVSLAEAERILGEKVSA
jgi:long-chain acyl-CoA synthetase